MTVNREIFGSASRCIVGILLFAFAPGTAAHHSFGAVFDRDQPIEVTGIVTQVEWRNPHVWFYVDIKNGEGEIENWAFELGSPNALIRRGWNYKTLQVGNTVTVHAARARDGSPRGAVLTVTLPSGKSLFGAQGRTR